jgi:5-methyltetrahydropteroyltriglutamate--homocysteine methyltransferase
MDTFPIYDDMGSVPLPEKIDKKIFNEFYWKAYDALTKNYDIFEHIGLTNFIINPIISSFKMKMDAGIEIINYPQYMDMYNQFLKPINDYQEELFLIRSELAIIPEIIIINHYAKEIFEQTNKPILLKVCVTGPVELYIKERGFTIYIDIALKYAESVNRFLKNSFINNKYIKTKAISIDEPSFGYTTLVNTNSDELIKIFDKSVEGINVDNLIHLHTLDSYKIPLETANINVLTCEYATDQRNIIPKKDLEDYDKYIRVGICRTNFNNLFAEALDSGIPMEKLNTPNGILSLIDSKDRIKKMLVDALDHYGDRLKYIGPDCGLYGWDLPSTAFELLHRIYEVIEEQKIKNP